MPVHSNPKRKKAARGGRWAMTIVLLLLLGVLVSMAVWAAWSLLAMPDQNKELELPETAQVLGLVLADTLQPQPEDFVTGLDGTGITVSFEERPDNTVGKQLVTLNFSDGKKTCSRQTTLQVFHLEQKVTVVMGQEQLPGIRDFVPDESLDVFFVGSAPDQIPLDQCGEKILVIACSGREYEVIYSVEERIAPQGTAVHGTTEAGKLPDPATLVTDIVDHSAVTVTYQQVPELTVVGSVNVTLVLTDAYGNTATVESVINVIPAANAPHFEGLKDLYIRLGNTIAYKADVTALDDKDGQVSFTVDASSVDNMTEGTYTVYYSATDSDGDTLYFEVVDYPVNGTLTLDAETGDFSYRPAGNFHGEDRFRWRVQDEWGAYSESACVEITVRELATGYLFSDVEDNVTHHAALLVSERGILSGEKMGEKHYFHPNRALSRAAFVAILLEAAEIKVTECEDTGYTDNADIPRGMRGAIKYAREKGWLGEDTVFRPHDAITRAEAAMIAAGVLGLSAPGYGDAVKDHAGIPVSVVDAMYAAYEGGYLATSADGKLMHDTALTRADAARFFARVVEGK
jgi:hypothetical protein